MKYIWNPDGHGGEFSGLACYGDAVLRTKIVLYAFIDIVNSNMPEKFRLAAAVNVAAQYLFNHVLTHADTIVRNIYFKDFLC